MGSLLDAGLSNAAAAAVLAIVATLVTRLLRGRRPAVVHALWLMVLLKLLMPPLWTLGVPWPRAAAPAEPAAVPPANLLDTTPSVSDLRPAVVASDVAWEPAVLAPTERGTEPLVTTGPPASPPAHVPPLTPPDRAWLREGAALVWFGGSIVCLALVVIRCWQFHALLLHATRAPCDVGRRVAQVAARLGIRHPPEAWLVPGAVCPMLWALLGRPRLLLPAALWSDLAEAQRDTLLAHELAHLRRRDHWVRLVEVAATVLYWWHPVAWWARRELREAEEQCCDAWVVWSMPRCVRPYMNAILKAVDFVSDAAGPAGPPWSRAAVPPVASGMASGQFRHLERRLSMIRQNENPGHTPARRMLGRAGLVAVCAGAAVLLPLAPSVAQQEAPATAQKAEAALVASGDVRVSTAPETDKLKVSVGGERPVVVQVSPEGRIRASNGPNTIEAAEIRYTTAEAAGEDAENDVEGARHEVERLSRELQLAKARLAMAEAAAGRPGTSSAFRVKPEGRDLRPSTGTAYSEVKKGRIDVSDRGPLATPTKERPGRDSQRRLDELEQKLDRLLDEVRQLKGERSDRGASRTPPVMLQRQ